MLTIMPWQQQSTISQMASAVVAMKTRRRTQKQPVEATDLSRDWKHEKSQKPQGGGGVGTGAGVGVGVGAGVGAGVGGGG